MTKTKAIKILDAFIKYKQDCLNIMNKGNFTTEVGDIRNQIADIYLRDKKILEGALLELKSEKKDHKEKSSQDILSLEMKKAIGDEEKKAISEYKKSQRKPKVKAKDFE